MVKVEGYSKKRTTVLILNRLYITKTVHVQETVAVDNPYSGLAYMFILSVLLVFMFVCTCNIKLQRKGSM